MDTIIMTRETGTNTWTVLHSIGPDDPPRLFEVNDGTGLTHVRQDEGQSRDDAEQHAGDTIRTMELVVQAYNGTSVGRSA